MVGAMLLLLGLAGGAKVPVQLNTTAFATCLVLGGGVRAHPTPDLPAIKASFALTDDDGILAYLAVYAGQRVVAINATIQQPAWEKFARPFWPHGDPLPPPFAHSHALACHPPPPPQLPS